MRTMHYILGCLPFGPGTAETLAPKQVKIRASLDGAVIGFIIFWIIFAIRKLFT